MLGRIFKVLVASMLVWGASANADIIYTGLDCQEADVTAGGSAAGDCLGIYDKAQPNAGPNDSESFLNNPITVINEGGTATSWGAEGAFGINTWDFLGKDDAGGAQTFINGSDGDPGTWVIDSALNETFLIAVKQDNRLGLWLFDSHAGATSGTFAYIDIFNTGIEGGWSHIAIYSSTSVKVPEPGTLALLGIGLLGIGMTRRQSRKKL